jgi:arylsulfatase A-like enzyme
MAARNLVLITLDTTRADHLGCYGDRNAVTPNLDALAKDGVVFDQAIAVAPITLPSHVSLLTSLYPPRHGVREGRIQASHRVHHSQAVRSDETHFAANDLRDPGFQLLAVFAVLFETRRNHDAGKNPCRD